jgi:hypothetical protein
MGSEFDELEAMSAIATFCRAARLLQMAETRCAALGVDPRGAVAERELFLALLSKTAAPAQAERDAA